MAVLNTILVFIIIISLCVFRIKLAEYYAIFNANVA